MGCGVKIVTSIKNLGKEGWRKTKCIDQDLYPALFRRLRLKIILSFKKWKCMQTRWSKYFLYTKETCIIVNMTTQRWMGFTSGTCAYEQA